MLWWISEQKRTCCYDWKKNIQIRKIRRTNLGKSSNSTCFNNIYSESSTVKIQNPSGEWERERERKRKMSERMSKRANERDIEWKNEKEKASEWDRCITRDKR